MSTLPRANYHIDLLIMSIIGSRRLYQCIDIGWGDGSTIPQMFHHQFHALIVQELNGCFIMIRHTIISVKATVLLLPA